MVDPAQWVCAKCGTVIGDEQSEQAVRELRSEVAKLRKALTQIAHIDRGLDLGSTQFQVDAAVQIAEDAVR